MDIKSTGIIQTIFTLVCCFGIFSVLYTRGLENLFWDLSAYSRAIEDFSIGRNPYNENVPLVFIYHPYVLWFFYFLNELIPIKIFFGTALGLSSVFFYRQLYLFISATAKKENLFSAKDFLILNLGSISFGGAGLVALLTGNVTVMLHFIITGTILKFIRSSSRKSFYQLYFFIILFSIIKPYLLSYLLILFLFDDFKRSVAYIVSASLFLGTVWFSSTFLEPDLYNQFVKAWSYQTANSGDLGYSLFGLLTPLLGTSLSLVLHILIMTFIFLILLKKTTPSCLAKNRDLFPLIYIVLIILINPRMKEYDFFIAVLFTFIIIYQYFGKEHIKYFILGLCISITPYFLKLFEKLGLNILDNYDYEYFYAFQVLALLVIFPFKILSTNRRFTEIQ